MRYACQNTVQWKWKTAESMVILHYRDISTKVQTSTQHATNKQQSGLKLKLIKCPTLISKIVHL